MLLPLACLKMYFLKFYRDWVSLCSIIRVKNSALVWWRYFWQLRPSKFSSPWLPLKWCLFMHGKNQFSQILPSNSSCSHLMYTVLCIWRILQRFLRIMTYKKGNICFHVLIFYRQIRLISCRSGFWHLRRKTALIFSNVYFFKIPSGFHETHNQIKYR